MSEGGSKTFKELLVAKRTIASYQKEEGIAIKSDGIKEWVWTAYGGTVSDYDRSFSEILSYFQLTSFRDFILQRKEKGLPTYVLDLMGGDASFLRDLKYPRSKQSTPALFDAGLCVTLVDGRNTEYRKIDAENNIEVLCGDITAKDTWNKISEWQQAKGVKNFDLIVCRGVGAVENFFVPQKLHPFLFSKIWERLGNDGLFVTQLPHHPMTEDKVTTLLTKASGFRSHFQQERIGKTKDDAYNYPALGLIKENPIAGTAG